jgi:hypothetical protein
MQNFSSHKDSFMFVTTILISTSRPTGWEPHDIFPVDELDVAGGCCYLAAARDTVSWSRHGLSWLDQCGAVGRSGGPCHCCDCEVRSIDPQICLSALRSVSTQQLLKFTLQKQTNESQCSQVIILKAAELCELMSDPRSAALPPK